MKTRLLARRPSPAMLVAITAVVLSLTGGAIAATIGSGDIRRNAVKSKHIANGKVKNKDLRNNTIKTTKVRNGTLLKEDFAADQLLKGDKGEKGDKGDKGDTGDPGEDGTSVFASTVPSGSTVTGAWGIGSAANAANNFLRETVSLPVRAPSELSDALVNMDDGATNDTDGDATCAGTAAAPTAPAGKVCIYTTFETNVNQLAGFQISSAAGAQNTYGFNIRARATAAGPVDARGTWAYTAP